VRQAALADADGTVLGQSAPAVEGRTMAGLTAESAAALRAQPANSVFLSRTMRDPATAADIVALARARRGGDGQFAGLALLAIDKSGLDPLARLSSLPPVGRVEIVRTDGTALFAAASSATSAGMIGAAVHSVPVTG